MLVFLFMDKEENKPLWHFYLLDEDDEDYFMLENDDSQEIDFGE